MGVEGPRASGAPPGVPVTPDAVYFRHGRSRLSRQGPTRRRSTPPLDPCPPPPARLPTCSASVRFQRRGAPARRPLDARGSGAGRHLGRFATGLSGGRRRARRRRRRAAALLFGERARSWPSPLGPRLAGTAESFLERWRVPGEPTSRQWEERFGRAHVRAARRGGRWRRRLKQGRRHPPPAVDVLNRRRPGHRARLQPTRDGLGGGEEKGSDRRRFSLGRGLGKHGRGFTPGLMLAAALDVRAFPDQGHRRRLARPTVADASVVAPRRRAIAARARGRDGGPRRIASSRAPCPMRRFLTWRGFPASRSRPRRARSAAVRGRRRRARSGELEVRRSPAARLPGVRRRRHVPPQRVCVKCPRQSTRMTPRAARRRAGDHSRRSTVDRLA